MADVRLVDVWKIYGEGVEAVRAVSVEIPDGAFCVLVGPSGCGKSTTLRMIAGLEEISRGTISIGGREVNDISPKDRDIAMVFQNYALYPHMTVEKNLSFALRLRGIKKDEIRRRVDKAAEQLGLTGLLGRRPGALSGGQRQRVALGRAMVREPSAFLFDEPLSNLDAKLRGSTRAELKSLHKRLRTTTVYVTHDQEEAMSLGDLIVVMAGGEVQQTGAPLDVFDRPANRFVAGFIGTPPMNFLDGTLGTDGGGLVFVECGEKGARLSVPLNEATAAKEAAARPCVLGIRPQGVELLVSDTEQEAARAGGRLLTVRIEMVEPLGEQMDLHARTAAGTPVVFRVPSSVPALAGENLDLVVDISRIRMFDPGEMGKSLAPRLVAGTRSAVGSAELADGVRNCMAEFPEDFVWGAASSAYQIEGGTDADGRTPSVWDVCAATPGFTTDGSTGEVACGSYDRPHEDAGLIGGLLGDSGTGAYRFSLSWSRVMPDGVGRVNGAGLGYYDRLVDALLARGVDPWVTLFHWDYPQVLLERGGWAHPDSPKWFAEYTEAVVTRLGDRVSHWMTLNEPQCFVGLGHVSGEHAPGLRLPRREALQVLHRSLLAHGEAVGVIRAHGEGHRIGWAPVGVTAIPETDAPGDIEAARRYMFEVGEEGPGWAFCNALYADPVVLGRYPDPTYAPWLDEIPDVTDDEMAVISRPIDFYGANIYFGTRVRAGAGGEPEVVPFPDGQPRTMMDWPVTPEALYWGPRLLAERYGLPVYITENGCATNDWVSTEGRVRDSARVDYLRQHLRELARARADGVDVRGYFEWSIMDNFEWAFGYTKRFGLVHVDFETGVRTPKDSYEWYRGVASSNTVD